MSFNQRDSYNEMPYTCKAFHSLNPEYLKSLAKIYDFDAPDLENARILELGCGSGEGLFVFAKNYPNSEYVGFDISEVHIDHGRQIAKESSINNVKLYAASLEDINKKDFGIFDYIICHGVFSWVPKNIQDKILDIIGEMLSEKGLALVSYNTLPGWNLINPIRDMLRYHTDLFPNKKDKVKQARAFIEFLKDTTKEYGSDNSIFIEGECQSIKSNDDSYLYHELLIEGNTEFYFSDFIELVQQRGLQYLSDSSLSRMGIGVDGESAYKILSQIDNQIVRDQYIDFLVNRRFRSSILCKKEATINRSVKSSNLEEIGYLGLVTPLIKLEEVNFKEEIDLGFKVSVNGIDMDCQVKDPYVAAMLYSFSGGGLQIKTFEEIILFIKNLGINCSDSDKERIKNHITFFLFRDMILPASKEKQFITDISDKPKVSKLVRHQSQRGSIYIFSELMYSIELPDNYRNVVSNLDGTNDIGSLVKKLNDEYTKKGLVLSKDGKTVTDEKLKISILNDIVLSALHFCKSYGFLIA